MSVLSAEERGDMAEALLPVAANLVVLVHGDGGPRDVHQALARLSAGEKEALLVVLAGMVDPDQPMGRVLGWLEHDEAGRPVVPSWSEGRTVRDLVPADEDLVDDGDYVDPVAVQRFVAGSPVEVTEAEYLAALAACFERGMTCPQVDVLRRVPEKTTENTINRLRKRYERRGEEFPELSSARVVRRFRVEQVVAMREAYAAGGVTDLELAMKYGVPRKTVTNALSGQSYPEVGGPIRARRGVQPSVATRVVWGSGAGFAEVAVG